MNVDLLKDGHRLFDQRAVELANGGVLLVKFDRL
jgi:hypothetical protein